MRRSRSSFRPQVNIPKAKKPKKEEHAESTLSTAGTTTAPACVVATVPAVTSEVEIDNLSVPITNNTTVASTQPVSAKEVIHTPVKSLPAVIPSAPRSPPPSPDISSSEDEGVIDPYDPNNPQGTRTDRSSGPNRKCDRLAKTSCGGKPTSMIDYLYYNPKENPMTYTQSKSAHPSTNRTDDEDEDEDNPGEETPTESQNRTFAPTVQLKLGPDGTFQVDEKSLVQETTEARKGRERLSKTAISSSTGITGSKNRTSRIKWTDGETVFFYKSLAAVGTDFEIISKYFPGRSRHHIKLKFKLEEKVNPHLISLAMKTAHYDVSELQRDFESVAKKAKDERTGKRKQTKNSSTKRRRRGSKKGTDDEEDEDANVENLDSSDEDPELEAELEAEMRVDEKTNIKKIKQEPKQTKTTPEKPQQGLLHTPGTLATIQQPRASAVINIEALKTSIQTSMSSQKPNPCLPRIVDLQRPTLSFSPPVRNPMIRQILSTGPRNVASYTLLNPLQNIKPETIMIIQNNNLKKINTDQVEQVPAFQNIVSSGSGNANKEISDHEVTILQNCNSETERQNSDKLEQSNQNILSSQVLHEETTESDVELLNVTSVCVPIPETCLVVNREDEPQTKTNEVCSTTQENNGQVIESAGNTVECELANNAMIASESQLTSSDNTRTTTCLETELDIPIVPKPDRISRRKEPITVKVPFEDFEKDDMMDQSFSSVELEPEPEEEDQSGEESQSDDEEDSSDSTEMEMEYLSKTPQPTRSGRVPKIIPKPVKEPVKKFTGPSKKRRHRPMKAVKPFYLPILPPPSPEPAEASSPEPSEADSSFTEESFDPGIAPGSLVILKTAAPDDPNNELYEVFMVPPRSGGATLSHNPDGSVQKVSVGTEKTDTDKTVPSMSATQMSGLKPTGSSN